MFCSAPAHAQSVFPHSSLDETEVPDYTESSPYYIDINGGDPDFEIWQKTTFPFVIFSELDDLGRAGPAYACLGPETLPKDVRKPLGSYHPSGWKSTRYDDLIDGGNLYNRSHLIGFQLCADNGSPENLFTGTRNLNAGSMLLVETAVEMYIQETGHHVLYRITPFYHGNDLVPFGIQMEAMSMETDEEGICCNLFLYNIQPGIEIDYRTGDSWRSEEPVKLEDGAVIKNGAVRTVPADTTDESPDQAFLNVSFVLNKNTHRFHNPDCPAVLDIKSKNRQDVDWSRDEVIAAGYKPSGCCKP